LRERTVIAETGDRRRLAEDRTELAEDRTLLANERTFASWLRTGLACAGVAIGLNALFRTLEPPWVAKAVATVFALVAIFIFFAAERRGCHVQEQLRAHQIRSFRSWRLRLIAQALMLATAVLIPALWLLV
jgi:putative membrane protein